MAVGSSKRHPTPTIHGWSTLMLSPPGSNRARPVMLREYGFLVSRFCLGFVIPTRSTEFFRRLMRGLGSFLKMRFSYLIAIDSGRSLNNALCANDAGLRR